MKTLLLSLTHTCVQFPPVSILNKNCICLENMYLPKPKPDAFYTIKQQYREDKELSDIFI